MARHRLGARALALGLSSTLLATVALAAAATAAPAAKRIDPELLRGRTGRAVLAGGSAPSVSAGPGAKKVAAQSRSRVASPAAATGTTGTKASSAPLTADSAGPAGVEAVTASASVSAAATTTCTTSQVWLNSLTDRSVVHAAYPGATSLTVQRQRQNGTWRTVGSAAASSVVVNDTTINVRALYRYRLIAKNGTTVMVDCITGGWYSTSTDDGFGEADAAVAGDEGLFMQGRWDQGDRLTTSSWVSPAFSTDGRLVAATRVTDPSTGRAVLDVRRAVNGALVFSVDLGATEFPGDPAFSPDAQMLAYTRYDAASGDPKGLGFVDVFGSHTKRALNTESPVGEPSWRPDGVTLVVTDFGGPGLAVVSSTGTTVTPLAGTTGGYTPEVGTDGTIWFTTADDVSSALKKKATSGVVTEIRSSGVNLFVSPRLTPDGTLYVEVDTPDPADPNVWSMEVYAVALSGTEFDDELTAIGSEVVDVSVNGWDVRQPQSKGTSDFTWDANHDLVARDGAGYLWAYQNISGFAFNGRTKLGTGWGGFKAIVAAGDLNSDDQADIVARDSAGVLWLYRSKPRGGFYPRTQVGTGWGSYRLVATGDWTGDDKADLIARDGNGTLWVYPGTGRGTLAPRVQIGTGWGSMTAIVGSGDVDYDAQPDLLARDGAGRLYLYPGNGKGGFLARRQIGTGWTQFTALTTTEATNGQAFLWARWEYPADLYRYTFTGDGTFSSDRGADPMDWSPFLLTS